MGLREWFGFAPKREPQVGEIWRESGNPWGDLVEVTDREPGWVRYRWHTIAGKRMGPDNGRHAWRLGPFRSVFEVNDD